MQALSLLWSALWRVQASHLAVFVLVPAAAAVLRLALGLVFLPFLLVGFGDRALDGPAEVAHLRNPGCWVALAPCALAEVPLLALPGRAPPAAATSGTGPEPEPFLPMPSDLTPRHAWFLAWLLWFVLFLVRRARRPAPSADRPTPRRRDAR